MSIVRLLSAGCVTVLLASCAPSGDPRELIIGKWVDAGRAGDTLEFSPSGTVSVGASGVKTDPDNYALQEKVDTLIPGTYQFADGTTLDISVDFHAAMKRTGGALGVPRWFAVAGMGPGRLEVRATAVVKQDELTLTFAHGGTASYHRVR